jgi:hypothetical protein
MPLLLRVRALVIAVGLLSSGVVAWRVDAAEKDAARGHDFFEARIRPVLVEHCYKCHSSAAGKTEGGLALDTRGAMRAGGSSGPARRTKSRLDSRRVRHDG